MSTVTKTTGMILCARGMLYRNTPIEDYRDYCGLFVKREDLSCPAPGPPFSKTRGVYAHIAKRPEELIGVLDTYHSQAGHAVARACQVLGKRCLNFYPEFVGEPGYRQPQAEALALGAELYGLKAGRSSVIYHQAKRKTLERGGYIMPNALKLEESVEETAKEVDDTAYDVVLIPASSATIAAGVVRGFMRRRGHLPLFIIHLGYSRSEEETKKYIREASGFPVGDSHLAIVDEGYAYKDRAKPGDTPPWPCNEFYDLKLFRWWMRNREDYSGYRVCFWNVG